jgi:hypothetical protein
MKRILPIACLASFLLAGCAHYYVITLNNGVRLTTKGKPKLEQGRYYFKDLEGKPNVISAGRVREMGPASMMKQQNDGFRTGPGQ